jgi:uncharacterized SAM-binding protein YcdF (DUF218 family)
MALMTDDIQQKLITLLQEEGLVTADAVKKAISKKTVEIYKNYLIDLGVKAEDIITEGNSKTTAENAKFTSELAKKMNYKKVIVVTSATHMNRAKKSFEKLGLEVIPAPGAYISDYEKYDITSWMPKVSNIEMIYSLSDLINIL